MNKKEIIPPLPPQAQRQALALHSGGKISDVQSQMDKREIEIDKVGVKNIRYPIVVEDRNNKFQNTVATIDIFVDLPSHHRGTHMSRFLEVLNSYHKETLIDNLEPFLKEVKRQLNSQRAFVKISFPYFIEKVAPVSKIKSLLDYMCVFEASLGGELQVTSYKLQGSPPLPSPQAQRQALALHRGGKDCFEFKIGVTVPITTLCPCSKEISDFGAHNQRSYVSLKVIYKEFIWIEELIEIIEKSASCEIYPLLKRCDEKYVTEKAFNNPVFVEDVVREITLKLQEDKRIVWFCVESENIESIHNHSAFAQVSRGIKN